MYATSATPAKLMPKLSPTMTSAKRGMLVPANARVAYAAIAAACTMPPMTSPRMKPSIRALRFLRKPGRDHSNGHTCAVDTVGHAPAHGRCHDEDNGIRSQERHAVAELIGRREEALFFSVVCRFNSPGIDHNVLCR